MAHVDKDTRPRMCCQRGERTSNHPQGDHVSRMWWKVREVGDWEWKQNLMVWGGGWFWGRPVTEVHGKRESVHTAGGFLSASLAECRLSSASKTTRAVCGPFAMQYTSFMSERYPTIWFITHALAHARTFIHVRLNVQPCALHNLTF